MSVRAMLALVLGVGIALGWYLHRVRVQREAIAAIEKAGGKVYYGWQLERMHLGEYDALSPTKAPRPPWPKWLVDRVGPDFYSTAFMVDVRGEADPVMPYVGRLGHLESVAFSTGPRAKDVPFGPSKEGMKYLRGLTRLRNLRLGMNWATGERYGVEEAGKGLAAIAGCSRLQTLDLTGVPLDAADLEPLRGLADLRYLNLAGTGVTDAALLRLSGLGDMRHLILDDTRVTGDGIAHLRGMTRLMRLDLAGSRVEGLGPFRSLPGLVMLGLARTPIGDAGLALASTDVQLPELTYLNLSRTRVTDAGLDHLRALPKLRMIELSGSQITDAGVAAFQQARPGIKVNRVAVPTRRPRAKAATPKK